MLLRVKNSQKLSRLESSVVGNDLGQAMVEYVLILIISVSIVLALISQIFRPFGEFIDSYMGSYVGCLLEYGELPSLGSSEPSKADGDSECNKKFGAASLTKGRPPINNNINQDGSTDRNTSNNNRSGANGSSGGNGGGASGGTYAGSASRFGSRNMNFNRRPSSGVESGKDRAGGKIVEIAGEENGGNSFFGSRNGNSRQLSVAPKKMAIGISGLTESERKKIERRTAEGRTSIAISENMKPPTKKFLVKKPEPKIDIPDDEPITVGNFIRYLFIAALVIALVLLIGGQALQMSKSYEK